MRFQCPYRIIPGTAHPFWIQNKKVWIALKLKQVIEIDPKDWYKAAKEEPPENLLEDFLERNPFLAVVKGGSSTTEIHISSLEEQVDPRKNKEQNKLTLAQQVKSKEN